MTAYQTMNFDHLNAMPVERLGKLFWKKSDELRVGHGKYGMWDFDKDERDARIAEAEALADVLARKRAAIGAN